MNVRPIGLWGKYQRIDEASFLGTVTTNGGRLCTGTDDLMGHSDFCFYLISCSLSTTLQSAHRPFSGYGPLGDSQLTL